DYEGDGRNANPFGNRAGDQESAGGDGAHAFAKALFDQRVGGEKLAAKIAGQQQQDDEHAADQVAEDQLKEGQISAIGNGRRPDDGQRGGLGGHDRKGQRPPGRGAAAQKIVGGVLLAAAEVHSQRGDAEQVGNDNRQVERMDAHRVSFPRSGLEARKSASRIVAECSRVKKNPAEYGAKLQHRLEFFGLRTRAALGSRLWNVLAYAFPMRYVLGFDGGGTKTDCVLMDEAGAILARSRSGSSNPTTFGVDASLAALTVAATDALRAAGKFEKDVGHLIAGLSGAADP